MTTSKTAAIQAAIDALQAAIERAQSNSSGGFECTPEEAAIITSVYVPLPTSVEEAKAAIAHLHHWLKDAERSLDSPAPKGP